MGKNQHSKDRLYVTRTEWKRDFGGLDSAATSGRSRASFRCLPFDHCALSLAPFADPVATADGTVFDIVNIVPYLKKHGKNPLTGEPLAAKDLIRLHFHKNAAGKFHCPITYKVFNEHSHIVAISKSGNVYSYDAVQKLNVVPKCWVDQISGETFKKSDIITIQDPSDMSLRKMPTASEAAREVQALEPEPLYNGTRLPKSLPAKRRRKAEVATKPAVGSAETPTSKLQPRAAAAARKHHFTTGATSGSFTSTAVNLETKTELAAFTDAEQRALLYKQLKSSQDAKYQKAFVRLVTNLGNLNIQLECALAPETCHNFLLLCQRGYYDNVAFHRNIRKFMIQGGDPDGSGRGGTSAFGYKFADEFCDTLRHDSRGVLSMANAGKNTNGSQFFILYGSAPHLDRKHSVFGRVVGGLDVLDQMEKLPVDSADRPRSAIVIQSTVVYSNPFEDLQQDLEERQHLQLQKEAALRQQQEHDSSSSYMQYSNSMVRQDSEVAVGKYLKGVQGRCSKAATAAAVVVPDVAQAPPPPHPPRGYGDFSSW